jgi:mannose-6-phosphate isomerase-like protein (cupin superfamily)
MRQGVRKIPGPAIIEAAGEPPKRIEEYIGRVNSGDREVSVARMVSPAGWTEPAQRPEFTEYTVVLKGVLKAVFSDREVEIKAGQALGVEAGRRVQHSSPHEGGAEYIAVCLPAFSPETVGRDFG